MNETSFSNAVNKITFQVFRIPGKEDLVYEYPGEDPEIIKLQQKQRKDLTNFKPPKSLSGQFVRSKVSKNQFVPNKNHAEVLTNQINTDTFQDKVSPPKMFDNVKGGIAQMLKEKEMSGGGSYLDNNNNGGNVKNEKKKSNFEKGYYDPFEVNSGDDLELMQASVWRRVSVLLEQVPLAIT